MRFPFEVIIVENKAFGTFIGEELRSYFYLCINLAIFARTHKSSNEMLHYIVVQTTFIRVDKSVRDFHRCSRIC